jgi:hypothetical protein
VLLSSLIGRNTPLSVLETLIDVSPISNGLLSGLDGLKQYVAWWLVVPLASRRLLLDHFDITNHNSHEGMSTLCSNHGFKQSNV